MSDREPGPESEPKSGPESRHRTGAVPVADSGPEQRVHSWVREFVVGLNLCPFARVPLESDALKLATVPGDLEAVLTRIASELAALSTQDASLGATTLILICEPDGSPSIAEDFEDYLDLFAMAEDLAESLDYSGVIQLASFHPAYRFADAPEDDPANWSNRSPVPAIHLLLEEAVTAAVQHHPDAEGIPGRNVERLREMGIDKIKQRV